MDLVQSLFNYAWQFVVYAFLVWLVYYFFKTSTRVAKISVTLAAVVIVGLGISSGVLQEQFDDIDAASEQHIKHIQAIQKTYS